jgi:hypothetical protein
MVNQQYIKSRVQLFCISIQSVKPNNIRHVGALSGKLCILFLFILRHAPFHIFGLNFGSNIKGWEAKLNSCCHYSVDDRSAQCFGTSYFVWLRSFFD